MSLKKKMVISFGLVIFFALSVFSIIVYYTYVETNKEYVHQIVKLYNGDIWEKFKSQVHQKATKVIQEKIQHSMFLNDAGVDMFSEDLNKYIEREDLFDSVFIFNPATQDFLHSKTELPGLKGQLIPLNSQHGSQPFFFHNLNTTYLVWPHSNSFYDVLILFVMNKDSFRKTLQAYLPLENSWVILVNNDQEVLVRATYGNEETAFPFTLSDFDSYKVTTSSVITLNDMYLYQNPEKLFSSNVILAIPQSFSHKSLFTLKNRIITALLVISWFAIWIILIVSNTITKPIRRISEATKSIESFDYSSQLKTNSKDEVGELVRNFENMRQTIKKMVTKDQLTQVYNRRFLMHIFEIALSKAQRLNTPLSCIMMDIDNFKQINDGHGHQIGDEFLVEIGKTLIQLSRDYDTPARYGGEEFIIILPDTSINEAQLLAERYRKEVEKIVVDSNGKKIRCTISQGIAEFDKENTKTSSQIMKNADIALYRAKEEGRNKTIVYHP